MNWNNILLILMVILDSPHKRIKKKMD